VARNWRYTFANEIATLVEIRRKIRVLSQKLIGSLGKIIDCFRPHRDLFAKSIRAGLFSCLFLGCAVEMGYAADLVTTGGIANEDPVTTGGIGNDPVIPPAPADDNSGCTEVLLEGDRSEAEICPRRENGEIDYDNCEIATIPCTIVAVCPAERGEEAKAVKTGSYFPGKDDAERYYLASYQNQDYQDVSPEFGAGSLNPLCFAIQSSPAAAAAAVAGIVTVIVPPVSPTSP
jgi:hypothetical protein